ncbi:hypothetical protein SDC9_73421 [bioreactor metagenome]|uniref:Uncharacterized protein n=1 Tax=bioreactor metagenome TaxID=1076179 RepID=A0A644YEJ1_9ZZZZ
MNGDAFPIDLSGWMVKLALRAGRKNADHEDLIFLYFSFFWEPARTNSNSPISRVFTNSLTGPFSGWPVISKWMPTPMGVSMGLISLMAAGVVFSNASELIWIFSGGMETPATLMEKRVMVAGAKVLSKIN